MKLNKRKGFTVVELVIVIAIIAVLAAVLIPTFAGLVRKANISKDTQLVRNLNTALATATEKPKTMHEALQIAADAGYLVDKINASATSNEILYDSKNNVFCYYNATNPSEGSVEYIPESAQGSQINDPAEYYLLWKIYDKDDDIPDADKQNFSIYLADDAKVPENGILTVSVGFDAGTNTKAKEVTYNGTKGNSVVIRTYGGTLTVDAIDDIVNHYGTAGSVIIENVAGNSYHEFGNVDILTVKNGRVVVENGNNIAVLQVTGDATPVVAVPQNVVLETVLLVESGKSFKVAVGDKRFEVKAGDKVDNIPAELEKALTKDAAGNLTFGVPGNYVAIIGTTPYESFTEALDAVKAGETIKLVDDTMLTEMKTIDGKTFTLDLNGHQIKTNLTALNLVNSTNMTVQDTSATASGMLYSGYTGIIVAAGTTLTVKSGTVKGDATAVSNSGTVNIEGTANLKRNVTYSVDCKSGSTTNMTGGTVFDIGTTESTYNYDVNISGGTVENYVYATSVTGGTIKDLILINGCEVKNATIIGSIKWLDTTVPTLTNVTLGEKFTIKNDGYELVNGVIKAKN